MNPADFLQTAENHAGFARLSAGLTVRNMRAYAVWADLQRKASETGTRTKLRSLQERRGITARNRRFPARKAAARSSFSGCNMGCVFCQNMDISQSAKGVVKDAGELADIMLRLQELGSNNINLVTPAPHVRMIAKAVPLARMRGLRIPIVYNTNAYEKVEALRLMEGLVDIYLPDLKYVSSAAAKKYSRREDYFSAAAAAVREMQRQCGVLQIDKNGIAKRGMIVRHLVLPGSVDEARGVLDFIRENLPLETHISLMSQYTPMFELQPPLNRRLLKREYKRAVDYALSLGFENIYTQSLSSASAEFTPEFNGFFE